MAHSRDGKTKAGREARSPVKGELDGSGQLTVEAMCMFMAVARLLVHLCCPQPRPWLRVRT